ncbi:MAG: chloride channel protein, partial [Acidobacteriaceae bacterium]
MADLPNSDATARVDAKLPKKGFFGVALEPEVVKVSAYALLVGLIGGLVAQGLLELIYLFTNIFFYGKLSFAITYPAHNHLGLWVILIPPIGGLAVGFMIHYWEPTLKGHGIPEAMEAVLFGQSRMRLRVAILKPLATAFAIGTGGP